MSAGDGSSKGEAGIFMKWYTLKHITFNTDLDPMKVTWVTHDSRPVFWWMDCAWQSRWFNKVWKQKEKNNDRNDTYYTFNQDDKLTLTIERGQIDIQMCGKISNFLKKGRWKSVTMFKERFVTELSKNLLLKQQFPLRFEKGLVDLLPSHQRLVLRDPRSNGVF